eukprot:TRINITY_DN80326_c0_g1_i1.p1 TRINITY_DN80326_c0_g1~~TRINITY_DN80326_c0_g1_i1.p1  ORF type:complete len:212 (+),score=12.61 TRINITY_DN80326_c0_g1_i1:69-638(+)
MHRQLNGWCERIEMEQAATWRFEDQMKRGILAKVGEGSLGQGIAGSTTLAEGQSCPSVAALSRSFSMPAVGPLPPCGRRVGDDLGVVDRIEDLEVPPLRRPARLTGDLEDRLQCLELSFSSKGGGSFLHDSLTVPSTGGRATRQGSSRGSYVSSRGLYSRGLSSRAGSALPTPLLSRGRASGASTPMIR